MTQENSTTEASSTAGTASATLPNYTVEQIASYLSHGYWNDTSQAPHAFATSQITYNIDGLTAEGKALAQTALNAWAGVSGISFVQTSGTAQITFDDNESGAYASHTRSGSVTQSAFVNVSTAWISSYGTSKNSYSQQTYIHELGHALGLGHAGNYNGNATWSANGDGGNHFLNDSWQSTVMSYFSQDENTAVNASYAFVVSPMMADIAAIQSLYGAPTNVRSENTTYGFNSNSLAEHNFAQYAQGNVPAFTIFDTGGTDTVDASGFSVAQRLDLRSGQYSNIGGETGNIGIYLDTIVENAVGGTSSDTIIGNQADNLLIGNAGGDQINGGEGSDTIWGNRSSAIGNYADGADSLFGESGNDLIYGNQGNDMVAGGSGADTIFGGLDNDTLWGNASNAIGNFADGADIIWGQSGDDTIYGNQDNDFLYGGEGVDTILGGLGNDTIWGNDPNSVGNFTDGGDTLRGQDGDDLIYGNQGSDTIAGGAGSDRIYGGLDGDILYGNDVGAWAAQTDGDDTIYGQGGNDWILGHQGNDCLFGEDGEDVINGGSGDDGLSGGASSDTFVFEAGWGFDAIVDFVVGVDLFDFRALAASNVHSISDLAFSYYNSNLVVEYGGSNVQLIGFSGSLQGSDFLFA